MGRMAQAAHYDPNKVNTDGSVGGWWQYSNSSDDPYIDGPPGTGTANSGWNSTTNPGLSPFNVPLGAYPGVQSPWGLLDVGGGTTEWTEGVLTISTGQWYRIHEGSR